MIARSSRPPSEYTWRCLTSGLLDFQSRARRAEYGSFCLFTFIYLSLALGTLLGLLSASGVVSELGPILIGLFTAWILVALAMASVRRLHDVGYSGWFSLLLVIPVLGLALVVGGILRDGAPRSNRFGESPKYRG